MKLTTLILSMLFISIPACNTVTESEADFDTSLKPGADTATSLSGTETSSAADSNTENTIDTGVSSDTGSEAARTML